MYQRRHIRLAVHHAFRSRIPSGSRWRCVGRRGRERWRMGWNRYSNRLQFRNMSVVQQHGFDGGVATSKAVIITSSTAGTSIIVGSCGNGAASGVPTDNIGNTWPAAALGPISATQNLTVWVLPGNLNTGGITTVTIH